MADRELDLVLHGATGFTGSLIAEYLALTAERDGLRWALAGRNVDKLDALRAELGVDVPTIVADGSDAEALRAMAERARLVIAAAGPYQLYGSGLVAACAAAGTDYVDLAGEPAWIREMIDAHAATAEETGARIVFSGGFDSVPSDLGVLLLQERLTAVAGAPAARVKGRVLDMRGGASGGTVASLGASLAAAAADDAVKARLADPFALTPGFRGPDQPDGRRPSYDEELGSWAGPFVMAPINTKAVHRTNALLGHRYGTDFVYDEMVATGDGEAGEQAAVAMGRGGGIDLRGDVPAPGEGPSAEEREAGGFLIAFTSPDHPDVRVTVEGFQDPGYGCTSKMIAEVARTMLADEATAGGVWTPAASLGARLADDLVTHGVLGIEVTG